MAYTASDLAADLTTLRPRLLQRACQIRRCQTDDAEDLVQETTCYALEVLSQFQSETGINGLFRWLSGILKFVIEEDRRQHSRLPTVPIEQAANIPAQATIHESRTTKNGACILPSYQCALVTDWLDGYSQTLIAHRHGIHRNTVANRLTEAFETLKEAFPRPDEITYDASPFQEYSSVTIYRKPQRVWRVWRNNHPPEFRFSPTPRRTITRVRRKSPAQRQRPRMKGQIRRP